MKKLIRMVAIVLVLCTVAMLFAACGGGNNAAKPFIGKWNAYKVATGGSEIVFSDYASIAKMELTAEFTKDGTYVFHYYVNGEEGSKYPQSGTYEARDGKLYLDDGGIATIEGGGMVISMDNGAVKQYFKAA